MFYVVAGLVSLISIALALYAVIKKSELEAQNAILRKALEDEESRRLREVERMTSELAKLEKIRHIPDVIARSKRLDQEIATKLDQAQARVVQLVSEATKDREQARNEREEIAAKAKEKAAGLIAEAKDQAKTLRLQALNEIERDGSSAREALQTARIQASALIADAHKEARSILSQGRKDAKSKTQKVEDTLSHASAYAVEIRGLAEKRAEEIGGKAYESLKRHDFYAATAQAMKNAVDGYSQVYLTPSSHLLDELSDEYSFHRTGERLKVARERTRIMERDGIAATCDYPEGWKKDYAVKFVLGAFNGKVDALLARVKPASQGKLAQEIKDVFALTNHNGEVFKNARIREEYLDARLEELRWAVAVQRLKERDREEQRAMRERIREEAKVLKEIERATKQAAREEEMLTRALEKARADFESSSAADREKYEARLDELAVKLHDAEERNRRAMSMAQQTRCGHVYIISNTGSFGEDVFKIGLTRRLEPLDRVRELGDASVPFAFDVHAMIYAEDAPALEAALHRRFVHCQVNKVNRRKEFFRVSLAEIRSVIAEMGIEARWTIAAEAKDYRESLVLEQQMRDDPAYRARWAEAQSIAESNDLFDEERGEDDPGSSTGPDEGDG